MVVITEVMALHGRFRKLADHMQAHTHSATTSGRSEPPEIYVVQDVRSMDMHSTEYAWTKQLHGHIWECGGDIEAAEAELAKSGSLFSGQVHQALQAMTEKYGQENFTVARVSAGWGCEPRLEPWLIISDPDDAARWAWEVSGVAFATLAVLGFPALVAPDLVMSGFTRDPVVIDVGRDALRLLGATIMIDGVGMVLIHALLGAGAGGGII